MQPQINTQHLSSPAVFCFISDLLDFDDALSGLPTLLPPSLDAFFFLRFFFSGFPSSFFSGFPSSSLSGVFTLSFIFLPLVFLVVGSGLEVLARMSLDEGVVMVEVEGVVTVTVAEGAEPTRVPDRGRVTVVEGEVVMDGCGTLLMDVLV